MNRSAAAEKFGEIILWEQAIQIIARDFVKPGDFVIDVGANVGGISVALSRMTGPEGRVAALECNPEILPVLTHTLELNEASNVDLVERAAYAESGLTLSFQVDPSLYSSASKLTDDGGAASLSVITTTLNDVVRDAGRDPAFIKIDVEGAEFSVLSGASDFLDGPAAPPIVLEYSYQPVAEQCPLVLLERKGYEFWDVYLYQRMSRSDYEALGGMSNILALPAGQRARGYRKSAPSEHTPTEAIQAPSGRSLVRMHIDGDDGAIARVLARRDDGALLSMFQTSIRAMRHPANSTFVFDFEAPTTVHLTAETENGDAIPFRTEVSEVTRLG